MSRKKILFVLCSMFFVSCCLFPQAITYEKSGGRLGDQLIYYAIAKYFSVKYKIYFYYQPFTFSNQLVLSSTDEMFRPRDFANHQHIAIGNEEDLKQHFEPGSKKLFIVTDKHWKTSTPDMAWYGMNSSAEFRQRMRGLISPKRPIQYIALPKDGITVALHYRTGERHDKPEVIASGCNNIPFFDFYIKQINILREMFPRKKLYVHIFTDAYEPQKVVEKFRRSFNDPLLFFSARMQGNSWQQNVLQDLFAMTRFDCLIRPHSGFSAIAQLMGLHKIILFIGGSLILDEPWKNLIADS